MSLLKEFKPALVFLGKFLAIYLFGNILYGMYIESYYHEPDPLTGIVTGQACFFLNKIGYSSAYENVSGVAKVAMVESSDVVLYVFEGCNGLNVMIVFIAFLFAYGGRVHWLAAFLLSGILLIHLFNLLRIGLLYHLALNNDTQFYYYHKYFFTGTLYLVVFGLWVIWITMLNERRKTRTP